MFLGQRKGRGGSGVIVKFAGDALIIAGLFTFGWETEGTPGVIDA